EVRVGLTERHGSDGERLAALENHAALPGLPAARRDADAPHPRRRCDGHRRRAAVDAVHTDVRALRNGRHRERSPCGLQPHVQLLTRAGSLDAERGGVVDVARRAQTEGTVARGHADHTGSQSRGDAVRSEEHTSELQSLAYLVCRLLLEKKKNTQVIPSLPSPPAPTTPGR